MVENGKKFQVTVNIIMTLISVLCIAPFVLLIASSVTDDSTLIREGYNFWPGKFSLEAYRYIFTQSKTMIRGYFISIGTTVVGTVINLTLTTLLAYPLARKDMPLRNLFAFLIFFTMLFNGGLVPSYMMWTQIFHIKNTYVALLVPNLLLSAFNVIMMRTNIAANIPFEVIEAAKIEGCSEWKILYKVVVPMSVPILATLAILVGLRYWNDWTNGLYYITQDRFYSVQVYLNRMLQDVQYMLSSSSSSSIDQMQMPATSMKMAVAVAGSLPMILIYPFFQKYFVKGITIGAVKG